MVLWHDVAPVVEHPELARLNRLVESTGVVRDGSAIAPAKRAPRARVVASIIMLKTAESWDSVEDSRCSDRVLNVERLRNCSYKAAHARRSTGVYSRHCRASFRGFARGRETGISGIWADTDPRCQCAGGAKAAHASAEHMHTRVCVRGSERWTRGGEAR